MHQGATIEGALQRISPASGGTSIEDKPPLKLLAANDKK
jgi:hypothetical protein